LSALLPLPEKQLPSIPNMIMKLTAIPVFLVALLNNASGGTVTISGSAPTNDILLQNNTGGTQTKLYDEDRDGNHARGQLFNLPDGAGTSYQITSITVRKSSSQTYSNDTLTIRIFEGTQANWEAGTGHGTPADGSDYYVDTAVTPIYVEAFTLNGTINDSNYVTFQFTTPVTVNEDSDFGFLMTYDESTNGAGGTSPDYFQHFEGSAGKRISITTSDHVTSINRHIRYIIQGSAAVVDPDSDDDGLEDSWENLHFKGLAQTGTGDPDGDGADNETEETAGTNPNDKDSDDDGLDDDVEIAGLIFQENFLTLFSS